MPGSRLRRLYELRSNQHASVLKEIPCRKGRGFLLASPARFERAAFRLGGECSILLSYGDPSETTI